MVTDTTTVILLATQFATALLTVLLLLRIAYILSANPIGEFTRELVYLRGGELRRAGFLVVLALLVEIVQLLYPLTVRQGWLRDYPDLALFADAVQGILLLVATTVVVLVVRRYTHRSLDRRIRESMETLAYLEGQRRRRRQVQSGEWETPVDEE